MRRPFIRRRLCLFLGAFLPDAGSPPCEGQCQREADCEWRVTASLNYADKSALALSPPGHSIGPAEANAGTTHPLVAARAAETVRIGEGPR